MIASRHTLDDARVVHREAATLREAGHKVTLLFTCNERWEYTRHDGSVLLQAEAPDGKAEWQGMQVIGRPRRNGLAGKWRSYREMSELAERSGADVFHAHEPDLALVVALRAKRLAARSGRKTFVVHDLHEYPPGETVDTLPVGIRSSAHLLMVAWDWRCARSVDHAFTANSVVRGYHLALTRRAPVDVLYNGPSMRRFPQVERNGQNASGKLVLVHEGALSFDRGLREMVEVVDRLKDRVQLLIVGEAFGAEREWLEGEIARRSLGDAIRRTGWLPYHEVGNALNAGDVGLILFRECLTNIMAGPPNKLFNYMNAGLPVLSVPFPEMRRIIREEDCGVLIEDQSVDAIVGAIEKVLAAGPDGRRRMSEAGKRAIRERYAWEQIGRVMIEAYEDIALRLSTARGTA